MKDELRNHTETAGTNTPKAAKNHILFAAPRNPLLAVSCVTVTGLRGD
jgi:hypothetical protein